MYATLIAADVAGMPPGTNLYQLDEPLDGFQFVNVCACEPFNQSFVIGCDETGFVEAPTMEGLWHSDAFIPHAAALAAIGYQEATP